MIIGLICVKVIVFVEMNVFSSCWPVSFVRANNWTNDMPEGRVSSYGLHDTSSQPMQVIHNL